MTPADWGNLLIAAFRSLLDATEEGVLVFDTMGVCRVVGGRTGEIFGVDPTFLVGNSREETLRTLAACAEDPRLFLEAVGVDDRNWPAQSLGEHELRAPVARTVTWSSYPLIADGWAYGRLCIVRDVTRERAAERARVAAERRVDGSANDPLTGLAGRRRFLEELSREHARALRTWDSYGVFVIDIDGMGEINRSFGTQGGDRVLEALAGALKGASRDYDYAARFENDDQLAALAPTSDDDGVQALAERILEAVRGINVLEGRGVTVTIGAAVWSPTVAEKEQSGDVLERAMKALDRARAQSKPLEVDTAASRAPRESVPPAEGLGAALLLRVAHRVSGCLPRKA